MLLGRGESWGGWEVAEWGQDWVDLMWAWSCRYMTEAEIDAWLEQLEFSILDAAGVT